MKKSPLFTDKTIENNKDKPYRPRSALRIGNQKRSIHESLTTEEQQVGSRIRPSSAPLRRLTSGSYRPSKSLGKPSHQSKESDPTIDSLPKGTHEEVNVFETAPRGSSLDGPLFVARNPNPILKTLPLKPLRSEHSTNVIYNNSIPSARLSCIDSSSIEMTSWGKEEETFTFITQTSECFAKAENSATRLHSSIQNAPTIEQPRRTSTEFLRELRRRREEANKTGPCLTTQQQEQPYWDTFRASTDLKRPSPFFRRSVLDTTETRPNSIISKEHDTSSHLQEIFSRSRRLREQVQVVREAAFGEKEARRKQIRSEHISSHERKAIAQLERRRQVFLPIILFCVFAIKCNGLLRERHLLDTHKRLLSPILSRILRVRRLKASEASFTNDRLPLNPRPSIETLRRAGGNPAENFFARWTDVGVAFFISLLKPRSFRKGQCMMHAGDMDRIMYIVTRGDVMVIVKKKTPTDKRRNAVNAQAMIPLQAPTYVGEFALLCREPRGATIRCETEVDTWCIGRDDFERVLSTLSPHSLAALDEVANNRRRSNMLRFFPLQPDVLRPLVGFSHMGNEQLKALIAAMSPHVLVTGSVFIREDEYRPDVIFVTDGTMEVSKPSDPCFAPVNFGKGFSYGLREALFHHEASPFTLAAVGGVVELWLLKRSDLFDTSAFFPGTIAASIAALKQDCCTKLVKASRAPQYVINDPFLRHVIPPNLIQSLFWRKLAEPVVFSQGEVIIEEGATPRYIHAVSKGTVTLRYGASQCGSDMSERNDTITVDPVRARCVYSVRRALSPNLARFHPSIRVGSRPTDAFEGHGRHEFGFFAPGPRKRAVCDLAPPNCESLCYSDANTATQDAMEIGFLIGTFEFASSKTQNATTAICETYCEVWRVDAQQLREELEASNRQHALGYSLCADLLNMAWSRAKIKELLLDIDVPCEVTVPERHPAPMTAAKARSILATMAGVGKEHAFPTSKPPGVSFVKQLSHTRSEAQK